MTAFHPVEHRSSSELSQQPDICCGDPGAAAGSGRPEAGGETSTTHTSSNPNTISTLPADFYQAAVLNAGIPIVALDPTGRIRAWNLTAVRMFGRSEAEVVGRPLETLIPNEYRPIASSAFQRTIQQRSVNLYEMTIIPQGGKNPLHVGVTLSCVIDHNGVLQGVMAWMRDISNRKELEEHLTRTRHMAAVGTLAGGVAHHFNNIACAMGPMVDFALATKDPHTMLEALRMAQEASGRMAYITQSLLACSREAGNDCEQAGKCGDRCDLTEELRRFADAVVPTLKKKGIALDLDLQAKRATTVPRIRFGQALQHLLQNAEDAIDDRCCSTIGCERRITLRTQSQGEQIMLQFADTGIGIDPDALPQIFDPFFTKKGVQGGGNRNNPGLGLTLVHSVILDMGGHIWADSTPDRGTTIHALIPVVN
jgi:PAS domain S-box-containing protein